MATATYHKPRVVFDQNFIERRMRQHQEWQQDQAARDASEIICEVSQAFELAARLRSGKGPRRIARLK